MILLIIQVIWPDVAAKFILNKITKYVSCPDIVIRTGLLPDIVTKSVFSSDIVITKFVPWHDVFTKYVPWLDTVT